MFKTLATLINGQNARAEDRVRDAFAIELIDQKIRESEASLRAAKATLASLIQRQRSEEKQHAALTVRISDLTKRARDALDNDREDMAAEAARAIANMQNEQTARTGTLDQLEQRVIRLRTSIESGHRRIIDLKQGAIQARAVRRKLNIQMQVTRSGIQNGSVEEAEELISRVLGGDDPFERTEILADINRDLESDGLADRMANAGFGKANCATADDVLARLKSGRK